MHRIASNPVFIGTLGFLLIAAPLRAADQNAETRLRETLKNTMLQLRDTQGQLATLQSTQADLDQKNKDLNAQLEKLTKQLAAGKDAADKSIDKLQTKLDNSEAEVAKLDDHVKQLETDKKKALDLAAKKESQRAKLEADSIMLQRIVADQQTKNAAMFKLGNEILTRYEKFGLGDAITAREPFVGITRVKFQNLIQDYSDQLANLRISPAGSAAQQKKQDPAANPAAKPGVSPGKKSGQKS